MSERLYILLPVHNRRAITLRLVAALGNQTSRDFCLVLIDDGSIDGTADAVRAARPETVVLHGTGQWWWAGCLQHGYDWLAGQAVAATDLVAIVNDDVEIAPNFLANARLELARHPDTLLLAHQIDATTGAELDGGGGVRADLEHLRFAPARSVAEVNCLPTRGLFLRWGDLQRAGGFRPRWLPHYVSDYEFTLRARQRGLHLRVAETFAVRSWPATTGCDRDDALRLPRRRRLALLASHRFKENPRTWSGFVCLAVSPWRRPWLLAKVWGNAVFLFVRFLVMPVPPP